MPVDKISIISINEARKILGQGYQDVPDSVIESIINDLEFMATLTIKHLKNSKLPAVPPSTVGGFQMPAIKDNDKEK